MQPVSLFDRTLNRIIDLTTILGGLAVVIMMLHIVTDVLLRFFLSSPLPGTISIVSYYYMVIVTFIPLAYAEKLGAHISVEIVYDLMPRFLRRAAFFLTAVTTTFVFALIAARSWQVAYEKYLIEAKVIQGGAVIPVWPGFFLVPFGMALVLILTITKTIRQLGARDPEVLAGGSIHD